MREEEISRIWRAELRLPVGLTKKQILRFWAAEDKPYTVRVEAVKEYGKKFNTHCLIETGTYRGDMIRATVNDFDKIISIELDELLYEKAKSKFSQEPRITIVHGDSGKVLPKILQTITEPCLFWLDGHYIPLTTNTARGDRDTPIMQELEHILNHQVKNHVILIDDARCFIGPNPVLHDYPTIQKLQDFIIKRRPDLVFEVRDDIIRIHQKRFS
ncbi:hypothetical protein [Paenibacillus sp. J2TS4]|uniref:hypothetical protein n=1 Tax=Paenibacillus sp. J2TS4 TaxID=2807194 RepID=UPI001B03F222|nr:hypothetical protein [Paenibacillus sp. J2TS4]GIP32530.1 hypothetical protein J2TS4_17400 [Paenibacillus sp. J2TS4]